MTAKNPLVDNYLKNGCGRCPLVGTPQCKVNDWRAELKLLRRIALECDLVEELKWKIPCYTFDNKNIVLVSAFKEYCSVGFFKGVLLKDPHGILEKPGENSQSSRLIRFTDVSSITENESIVKEYILEAIKVEASGLRVEFKAKSELVIPEELESKFESHPPLRVAFESLTLGRQRGYVLHFTAPKQSKTRTARIEKCMPQILKGKGMHD